MLDPGLRSFMEEALAAERRGDPARAAARYRVVLLRDPTMVPAVLGLGRSLAAQGELDEADAAYARMPHEAEVVSARARLLQERDPETALALYRRLETLAIGSSETYLRQALLLASLDPTQAVEALETWWELGGGDRGIEPYGQPLEDVVVAVALGLKGQGDLDTAIALLERCQQLWPEPEEPEQVTALLDRLGVERQALSLVVGGSAPLSLQQQRVLDRARRAFQQGELVDARGSLRELVAQAPRAPDPWAALGDVHLALGAVAEAERAYVAASTLAPDEASFHARLGMLLAERYAGRRHREAAAELNAALALRPTWSELHFRLAAVQREAGAFASAASSLRSYLAHDPEGAHAEQAHVLLQDLERRRPGGDVLPPLPAATGEIPDPARHATRVARVYRERGDLAAARAELESALELAPDYLDALMLLAALELEAGQEDAAIAAYERCLQAAPGHPRLLLSLGELRRSGGQRTAAAHLFEKAAGEGAPEAWYLLADMAMEDGRLLEARRHLDLYFQDATGGLVHEPALALDARVRRSLRVWRLSLGSGAAILLILATAVLVRRRTGSTLGQLLEREPAAYPEVARLLSAIRHEVLKHNTNLLASVAAKLEAGDGQAALYAAERLYGEVHGGGESAAEPGVIQRFESYLAELERVGGRHGLRLNLRRRDPVLAPMYRAMLRLRRLERQLRRPHRSSARLPRELRELSRLLNEEGFRDIGSLIQRMSVLRVDPALLLAVYRRVSCEPGLEGLTPATPVLEGEGSVVPVRIFRKDLEDIAANLLRNALYALVEELPQEERRVGIALVEEMDPVTGLETLAIRFRDNAPRPLTDAILRGRRIERGLGLAADLLARHDGVMNVETLPGEQRGGWTKAVVVRLPRAELAPEERS